MIRGVELRQNGGDGIALLNGEHNVAERNRLTGNGQVGIVLQSSTHSLVSKNSISGGVIGVDVFVIEESEVRDNSLSGATWQGIATIFSHQVLVEKNFASQNGDGIVIFLDSGYQPSDEALVRHNVLNRNLDDGIEVVPYNYHPSYEGFNVTLTSNIANHNGDLGIEAVPGVMTAVAISPSATATRCSA